VNAIESGESRPARPAAGQAEKQEDTAMIRVAVADDHSVVRKGIRQCIIENPDMTVVQEAGAARELFEFLGRSSCDVVVLDITGPDQSGLEVLHMLKQSHPRLPVLMFSLFPEETYAMHCLRAGAAGLLKLSSAPGEFAEAIRKAARGGRHFPPELESVPPQLQPDAPALSPHKALSMREFQVFCQLASGRAQKAIAAGLGLSAKTISTHRNRILKKMRIASNADIVRYALAHQLVA
jgi:DNA-binding NarL/FixJ family response regulator